MKNAALALCFWPSAATALHKGGARRVAEGHRTTTGRVHLCPGSKAMTRPSRRDHGIVHGRTRRRCPRCQEHCPPSGVLSTPRVLTAHAPALSRKTRHQPLSASRMNSEVHTCPTTYLCVCVGYSRGTRAARLLLRLGSRSPPTPCVPFAEEFQPYIPKAKAISDDGFASSSQLPGYEQDLACLESRLGGGSGLGGPGLDAASVAVLKAEAQAGGGGPQRRRQQCRRCSRCRSCRHRRRGRPAATAAPMAERARPAARVCSKACHIRSL